MPSAPTCMPCCWLRSSREHTSLRGYAMAMNVGESDDETIGTINTTPLVDVMLVLLIIFLITIPVVTTSIKVDLPKETNVVRETLPENLIISVDKTGHIFLYDTPVKNGQDLFERISKVATRK